jgi:hypothetical protein
VWIGNPLGEKESSKNTQGKVLREVWAGEDAASERKKTLFEVGEQQHAVPY